MRMARTKPIGITGGFSLIEVLVSMFLVGFGMLAIGELQTTALVSSQKASARADAAMLAGAMADRIRANPESAADKYSQLDPGSDPPNCHTNDCNESELAKFDVYRWKDRVEAQLPAGEAVICRDGDDGTVDDGVDADSPSCDASDSPYAIKVWWTDLEGKNDTERFVMKLER